MSLQSPKRPWGPATEASTAVTVSDLLVAGTGEWDRVKIRSLLPFDEKHILCLQPSSKGAPDALRWLGTPTGIYTVKTGYHTAMAEAVEIILEDEATSEFDWRKSVWNLNLPPKVKMFTWKSLKGILPVGERLVARHINAEVKCKRCGSSESINHLFFRCPFAREVWKLAPLVRDTEISGMIDLRADWMDLHGLTCLPPAGVSSTPLVPWILWSLWKSRNKFAFENFAGNPVLTLTRAIVAAREWSLAQKNEVKKKRTITQVSSLEADTVFRSDAAWSLTTRNAGIGWAILSQEQRLAHKQGLSCVVSALVAEGLALKAAMEDCGTRGLKVVRFEMDSSQLCKAITNRSPPLELYGVFEDISLLSLDFDCITFEWIPRERNGEADLLAKSALALFEQEVGETV